MAQDHGRHWGYAIILFLIVWLGSGPVAVATGLADEEGSYIVGSLVFWPALVVLILVRPNRKTFFITNRRLIEMAPSRTRSLRLQDVNVFKASRTGHTAKVTLRTSGALSERVVIPRLADPENQIEFLRKAIDAARGQTRNPEVGARKSAVSLLEERFARGELSDEEFQRKRHLLE